MKPVEKWSDEELLDHVIEDSKYRRKGARRTLAELEILQRMKMREIHKRRTE